MSPVLVDIGTIILHFMTGEDFHFVVGFRHTSKIMLWANIALNENNAFNKYETLLYITTRF